MKNLILACFLFCAYVSNSQIINFPDENFKYALTKTICANTTIDFTRWDKNADLNNDGEIDEQEALSITGLYFSGGSFSNMEGIKYFKNLQFLYCTGYSLYNMDVSELKELRFLNLSGNQISILNVSNLTNLEELKCGYNRLKSLDVIGLTKLKVLYCEYNSELSELTFNNNPFLTELYSYSCKIKSLNLSNMKHLKYVISNSNKLDEVNLHNSDSIYYLSLSSNSLTNLDLTSKSNLVYLSCSYNKLSNLELDGLTNLTNLNCDGNLIDNIYIPYNNILENFTCSRNRFKFLDISSAKNIKIFNCSYNYSLAFLLLKNGASFSKIEIKDNLNIKYICCDDGQYDKISELVEQNGLTHCEVNTYCNFSPGIYHNIIQGKVKFSSDSFDCNTTATNFPYLKFSDVGNGIINNLNYSNGNFVLAVGNGMYNINPKLDNILNFEITPKNIVGFFPSTSDTITQDFCITPKGIYRQTNITVIPLTPPARPGFEAKYKIVCENAGNQVESGTLNFTYDESKLDFISATSVADIIADGIVKWNFSDLRPFEKIEIIVTMLVNRPTDTPAVKAGDKLNMTASILDNIFTLENTVVGSIDPNDKTCLQGDRVHPDMIDKYVDYLIRFENTGTYAAENVVVKDIIDTKRFDVSTLQITDASHEVYTRIEGNKVEFIFENIQLPFDDANNDGYIAFKIKTLSTLQLGDSLKNLADIYFDYNFPIRTNEAQTTVALPSFTQDWVSDINVYPNPVSDILHLQTEETWTKAEIFDVSGRIIRAASLSSQSIDVSTLESGTYFVRLRNGDRVGRVKFVKM